MSCRNTYVINTILFAVTFRNQELVSNFINNVVEISIKQENELFYSHTKGIYSKHRLCEVMVTQSSTRLYAQSDSVFNFSSVQFLKHIKISF